MANFNVELDSLTSQLQSTSLPKASGVSFVGRKLKLDNANDAKIIVDEIEKADKVEFLNMEGNSLGVDAAKEISKALKDRKEFKEALWKDMFTSRLKNEIPIALKHLTGSLMLAGARLQVLDLSDNASGPIGVEGFEEFLRSPSCYSLRQLRLNNMGLGITGATKLASALLDLYNNSKNAGEPLKLEVFIAGRNRLENDGATALAQVFQKIGTLKEISIPQNGIYHAGITALSAAFNENLSLEVINLNDNTCTVKGARALAQVLGKLSNLKVLDCGDCLLRSKGALAIAESICNLNNLETVNLSFNEIKTEAGSSVLALLAPLASSLNLLNMDGNMFGPKICNELISEAEQLSLPLGSLEEDEGGDGDEYDEEPSDVDEEEDENDDDDDDEDGGEEEEEEELDDTESDHPYNIDGGKKVKKRKILKTPASPAELPEINLVTSLLENFSMTSPKPVSNPSECKDEIEISDPNNPVEELKEDKSESTSNSVGDVAEDSGCCEADNILSEISPHSPTDIVESVQNEGKMSLDDSCLNSPQNEMDIDDSEKNQKENNDSTEHQACTESQVMETEPMKINTNSEQSSNLGLPNAESSSPENALDENDIIMTHTSSPLQEKINTNEASDQKGFILPTDQEIPAIEKVGINKTEDINSFNESDNNAANGELVIIVNDKRTSDNVSMESCLMENNEKVKAVENDEIIFHSNVNDLETMSVNVISKDIQSEHLDAISTSVNVEIDGEMTCKEDVKEQALNVTPEGTIFNPDTRADGESNKSYQEIKSFEVIISKEPNQETLVPSLDNEISSNVEDLNQAVETPNDNIEAVVEVNSVESPKVTSTFENNHPEKNINSMNREPVINVGEKSANPVSITDYLIKNDVEGENKEILFLSNVNNFEEVSVNVISKDVPIDTINTNVDLGENLDVIATVLKTKRHEEMTCKGDAKEEVISSISEEISFDPNNKTVAQEYNQEITSFESIISKEANQEALVSNLEEKISNIVEDIKPVTVAPPFYDGIYIESVVQEECDASHKVIVTVEEIIRDNVNAVELIEKLEIVSLNNQDNSEQNDLGSRSTDKDIQMLADPGMPNELKNEINIKVETMEVDTIVYESKVEATSDQEPPEYEKTRVEVIVVEPIATSDQELIKDVVTKIDEAVAGDIALPDQEPTDNNVTKIAATEVGAIATSDQEPIEADVTKIAAIEVEVVASSDKEITNNDEAVTVLETVTIGEKPNEYNGSRTVLEVDAIITSDQEPAINDNTIVEVNVVDSATAILQVPKKDETEEATALIENATTSDEDPESRDSNALCNSQLNTNANGKATETVAETITFSSQEPSKNDNNQIEVNMEENVPASVVELIEKCDIKTVSTVNTVSISEKEPSTVDDTKVQGSTIETDTSVIELTKNVAVSDENLTTHNTKVDGTVEDSLPQSVQIIPSAMDTKENIVQVIPTPNRDVTKNMDNKLEDKSDTVVPVHQESSLESDVKPEIIPPYSQELSQVNEIKVEMVKPDLISGCEEKLLNINNSLIENLAKSESPSDLDLKTVVDINVEPNLIIPEKPEVDLPVKVESGDDGFTQNTSIEGDGSTKEKQPEVINAVLHGDVKQTSVNQPTKDELEKAKALPHSTKSARASPDSIKKASPVSQKKASPASVKKASPASVKKASPASIKKASPDSKKRASPDFKKKASPDSKKNKSKCVVM